MLDDFLSANFIDYYINNQITFFNNNKINYG